MPGFKASKDRVTLTGANAARDSKLKAMLTTIPKFLGPLRTILNLLCCTIYVEQQSLNDSMSVYNMCTECFKPTFET